ncbi:ATPase, T2SS/T4P/T4SS family [Amygdalobacter indicium]|uniref:ATPase, T2SS/T4P/T4SS family n=1 Tax=Amygdalobacter indicium TaxID=3029272 RepID=A0ABY8C3M5_9FIRM|nr:ATPase, T2SS/T4P/T4SS family [Amygdalobacter indicium]WEG35277.1 ATPase, T2SS/T4P/T4SS family [Amygdalobacter indicium]
MKLSLKEKLRKYIDKHKMLPQLKSIQVNRDERETNTLAIKNAIRSALYQNIKQVHNLSNQELWQKINIESRVIMLKYNITLADQRRIIQEIFDKIRGYDLLQPLISNPLITEIMVNRYDRIFYEQGGKIFHSQIKFENEQAYRELINHWFAKANRPLNHSYPIADLRLPDGSRAHAVIPPASPDGPILNIRKFSNVKPDRNFYISRKGIPEKYMEFLENAVRDKKSIFICGGTGSGKTTLLNILSASIPTDERVITIEDACELQLQNISNLVRLEAQRIDAGTVTQINLSNLIKASLRMRPDRIIVGEVRGEEAVDLLNAMNTGHPGALSTGHSNSCLDMLYRLSNLIFANSKIPYEAIQRSLASAIDYLVFIKREADGLRHVVEIEELTDYSNNQFILSPVYLFSNNSGE